jgi:hypothetical protein
MLHPDIRDESSKDPFRNHTESIVPIDESVSDEKSDIFVHLDYQETATSPGGTFATTGTFSISLPFVANFKKYIIAVNDLLLAIPRCVLRFPRNQKGLHHFLWRSLSTKGFNDRFRLRTWLRQASSSKLY